MRLFLLLCIISIALSNCSKTQQEPDIEVCLTLGWMDSLKRSIGNCFCNTGIFKGTYQGKTVYELRGIDARCQGVNIVYDENGSKLFDSSPNSVYAAYLAAVTDSKLIWSCADNTKN